MFMIKPTTLSLAALAMGCYGATEEGKEMGEPVRVALGVPVEEFNAQPALIGMPDMLSPNESGVFVLDRPHRLALEVHKKVIEFDTGGRQRPSYVMSGYQVDDAGKEWYRIRSVAFTATPQPVPLADVVALARVKCQELRNAGLPPREEAPGYAVIGESHGGNVGTVLADEKQLISAFLDPRTRVRTVELCQLEDARYSFGFTITNERRAREGRDGKEVEDELARDPVYTLLGSLSLM